MIYYYGNKHCVGCPYANVSIDEYDLDFVKKNITPSYDIPNCHYCEHMADNYDDIEFNEDDN